MHAYNDDSAVIFNRETMEMVEVDLLQGDWRKIRPVLPGERAQATAEDEWSLSVRWRDGVLEGLLVKAATENAEPY